MNKRQKEVIGAQLTDEQKTIKELKQVYKKAQADVGQKISELLARTDTENLSSIVYQINYQQAILKQIEGTLNVLNSEQFNSISDFLGKSYANGYMGVMYDLQGQGIPIIAPIDNEMVVKALQTDSQISDGLYKKLGVNTKELKDSIRANLSRGVSAGLSWDAIAKNIDSRMNIGLNRSIRIARTEGHRVQCEAGYQAQQVAKSKGADIVKQWCATLDGRTRPNHRLLDGVIKPIDEPFEMDGYEGMYPSDFGVAREDINCRCTLLQRAKWGLDSSELETLKDRAAYYGLDKTADFEAYKQTYLNATKVEQAMESDVLEEPLYTSDDEHYNKVLEALESWNSNPNTKNMYYNPVQNQTDILSEDDIIQALAGGDKTKGSCASLGLAYIGQKQGWNVLDYRDGDSQHFFSGSGRLKELSQCKGIKALTAEGASSLTVGNRLLKQVESGKEYYLCTGRHAAIVRKSDEGKLQYLELQSGIHNGWMHFDGNPRYTLNKRFGCTSRSDSSAHYDFMIDITDSDFNTDEFKSVLGYINTDVNKQRKGSGGTIK